MKVVLKRTWFAPNMQRFRKSINKHDYRNVPDAFRNALPRDAVVLDKEPEKVELKEEVAVLRDMDHFRAEEDSIAEAHKLADEALDKRRKSKKA